MEYGALLTYCPHGKNPDATNEEKRAYAVMDAVKNDGMVASGDRVRTVPISERVAEMMREKWASLQFRTFFTADTVLVPVPKSGKRMAHELWVPERVATALSQAGIGGQVSPCLVRETPIRKSAYCAPEDRPTAAEHYGTLAVDSRISVPERVVLVDDVVTSGAMLLASANKLADAYHGVQVRAFAVIRTQSDPSTFRQDNGPCVGTITLQHNGRTVRRP